MENESINKITEFAKNEFNLAYGFAGVMSNPEMVIVNTTDEKGKDIKIKITIEA